VVECTALEMRHTGNRIGGSNPSLSVEITAFSADLPDQPVIGSTGGQQEIAVVAMIIDDAGQ
jgi:hypothetical protein